CEHSLERCTKAFAAMHGNQYKRLIADRVAKSVPIGMAKVVAFRPHAVPNHHQRIDTGIACHQDTFRRHTFGEQCSAVKLRRSKAEGCKAVDQSAVEFLRKWVLKVTRTQPCLDVGYVHMPVKCR